MIAESVASLDIVSGGRVELGLAAGASWDAMERWAHGAWSRASRWTR